MAKITVFYEEHNEVLTPSKMVIFFGSGKIKWEKGTVYVPLDARFRRQLAEDFHDDTLTFSVSLAELVLNPAHPGKFGISLGQIMEQFENIKAKEITKFSINDHEDVESIKHTDIEQFVLQIADILEVMKMNTHINYDWSV